MAPMYEMGARITFGLYPDCTSSSIADVRLLTNDILDGGTSGNLSWSNWKRVNSSPNATERPSSPQYMSQMVLSELKGAISRNSLLEMTGKSVGVRSSISSTTATRSTMLES